MASSNSRWMLKAGLALAAFGTIAAIIAAIVLVPPWVRRYAVREARERGIELELGELSFGLGWLRLTNSGFRLVGVSSVRGRAKSLVIDLAGFEPERVEAEGIDVQIEGAATLVQNELEQWKKKYPETYRLPMHVRELNASWREKTPEPDWLTLRSGTISSKPGSGSLRAEDVTVTGYRLGKLGLDWTPSDAIVALGLGEDIAKAPIRAHVKHALERPTAALSLAPTDAARLGVPFGVKIPLKNLTVSAEVKLVLGRLADSEMDGVVQVKLKGYVPPHPPEIDGFVFGDTTTFDSKFRVNREKTLATLEQTEVKAGAFKLKGSGAVRRFVDHSRIQLILRGDLPCAALANSVAESRLGKAIGSWVGAGARFWLNGSVGVTVKVDADTRDVPNARVERLIGIGCGLRPLPGLRDWNLSKLPSALPLPSDFLPFPSSEKSHTK